MNRYNGLLSATLFLLLIFTNCGESKSHSRNPVTAIQLESNGKSITWGEEIKVNLETKLRDGNLDKIFVFVDGIQVLDSKNLTNSFTYKSSDYGVGKHLIKVKAVKDDGSIGENYKEIQVNSNVVPIKYTYKIITTFPHNPDHFTQGLEFHDSKLYEGTGQEGSSALYQINLQNGKEIRSYKLDDQFFGEGITILDGKIYQLTYKHRIGFVYDLNTFKPLKRWAFSSQEGWGLTNDGKSLIMSDGTEFINFINPITFQVERKIQVCDNRNLCTNINELEYIKGDIWANVWQTDRILIIDPKSGVVKAEIDMSGLSGTIVENPKNPIDVLNGIAWNPENDKIYVTGKLWPKLFEIQLVQK
ncbi:MAG: glutaminyl-peptide cyclotransferase [Marinilabiliales bacterium]|nr:glutaminyl-peptide cyclotransferase [Marinilabiliales bacterium]